MKKQLFFLAALIAMVCIGCSNDDEDVTSDLVSGIEGLYEGNWNVQNNAPGSCEVVRVGSNSVKLILEIKGNVGPDSPNINVSNEGNGKIYLDYTDSEGTVSGKIQGNTITLKIIEGTYSASFTGTKK